jgi:uncharacterized DUF497 family protein
LVGFEWDEHNLRKIRAHGIRREEAEQALANHPMLAYEQVVDGEIRFMYYSETGAGRLLAVIHTERGDALRVVTAYDLSASQKRRYFRMRAEEG